MTRPSRKSKINERNQKLLKMIDTNLSKIEADNRDLNTLSSKDRAKQMSVVLTDKIAPEIMTSEEIVATGRYPYTNYFGKLTNKDLEITYMACITAFYKTLLAVLHSLWDLSPPPRD